MSRYGLRGTLFSAAIVSFLGCQAGRDPAQLAKERTRAEAAEADAHSARTALAAETARADAVEVELAKLRGLVSSIEEAEAENARSLSVVRQLAGKAETDPNLPGQPVTQLDLRGTPLTDAGLSSLTGLKNVRVLRLGGNQITDTGLAQLAKLPRLEELILNEGGGQITDLGLASLGKLESLKKVTFGAYSNLSGAGVEKLKSLEYLDIAYSSANDQTLERIATLKNLRYLRLDHNGQITDAGLAHLKSLTHLQTLGLYNVSQITDEALTHLHGLKDLKLLLLQQTKVSNEGVQAFQVAVPACSIQR